MGDAAGEGVEYGDFRIRADTGRRLKLLPNEQPELIPAIGIVTRRSGRARLPTVMWISVGSNPSKAARMS